MIYRDNPSYKYIPAIVRTYSYNDDFIIAKQLSTKPCEAQLTGNYSYDDCLQLLNQVKQVDSAFWIVDHRNDKIYGPLKYSAFVKIAGELAIPKSLVLPVMQ
jgi:hypothetical protein